MSLGSKVTQFEKKNSLIKELILSIVAKIKTEYNISVLVTVRQKLKWIARHFSNLARWFHERILSIVAKLKSEYNISCLVTVRQKTIKALFKLGTMVRVKIRFKVRKRSNSKIIKRKATILFLNSVSINILLIIVSSF